MQPTHSELPYEQGIPRLIQPKEDSHRHKAKPEGPYETGPIIIEDSDDGVDGRDDEADNYHQMIWVVSLP